MKATEKKNWRDGITKKEDLEKHAERLLRRMKRDLSSISIGNVYLMAGYRSYILNGSFITKNEAKEFLVTELWKYFKMNKSLDFVKYEKEEHITLFKDDGVDYGRDFISKIARQGYSSTVTKTCYEAEADFVTHKKIFNIYQKSGKWRIKEIENTNERWSYYYSLFPENDPCFNDPEEAILYVQNLYEENLNKIVDTFK